MVIADHGYTTVIHRDGPRGCICPEEFDHGGKCQNGLRDKKQTKCIPCSQDWHWPWACQAYVSKGITVHSTQCATCGWDSGEHRSLTY